MYHFITLYNIACLVIYLVFIYKVKNIDCECSEDWKRDFIMITSYIFLGINLLFTTLLSIKSISLKTLVIISNVIIVLNCVFVAIMFYYTNQLKKENCECSNIWEREFMYITSLISVVLICFNIISVVLITIMYKKNSSQLRSIRDVSKSALTNTKKRSKGVKKGKKGSKGKKRS